MYAKAIIFRQASEADLVSIVRLLADDCIGATREKPLEPLVDAYRNAFKAISADKNQLLAVAVADKTVVGTLQISFIPGISRTGMWRGQIEAVRIKEKFRSEGLGRKMLEWGIERCIERNCGLVQLTADKNRPKAHLFYESMGFIASHEGYKLLLCS